MTCPDFQFKLDSYGNYVENKLNVGSKDGKMRRLQKLTWQKMTVWARMVRYHCWSEVFSSCIYCESWGHEIFCGCGVWESRVKNDFKVFSLSIEGIKLVLSVVEKTTHRAALMRKIKPSVCFSKTTSQQKFGYLGLEFKSMIWTGGKNLGVVDIRWYLKPFDFKRSSSERG